MKQAKRNTLNAIHCINSALPPLQLVVLDNTSPDLSDLQEQQSVCLCPALAMISNDEE